MPPVNYITLQGNDMTISEKWIGI